MRKNKLGNFTVTNQNDLCKKIPLIRINYFPLLITQADEILNFHISIIWIKGKKIKAKKRDK